MANAIIREEIRVTETVMGIDLINEPIIPVDKSKGKNAQVVANVVEVKTTLKSRSTKSTASSGVNFPVLTITPKVAKKTNGMASPATMASLRPTIKKRIPKTKIKVRTKS